MPHHRALDARVMLRFTGTGRSCARRTLPISPPYDGPGQPTALAAANVAYEVLSLRALTQRQG
jgi:hypothetical protein